MSRRAVLWIAFAVVHLGVAWLGFLMPNRTMGDVHNVYDPWSRMALDGSAIRRDHRARVYPGSALLPMIAAQGLAPLAGYLRPDRGVPRPPSP
ncbi:hypothetical protein [Microbacterium aurum]